MVMTDFASYKSTEKQPIAYVRAVRPEDLPAEVRDRTTGMAALYAVATSEGQVLALTDDRTKAFVLARMNDFSPVSVH